MQGFGKLSQVSGLGGDAITVKHTDGCWQPYLSSNLTIF